MSGPATTTTTLTYIAEPPKGIRAYQKINADPITGERDRNFDRVEKPAVVENLRGKEDTVSLDTAGFQYYKSPAKHTAFTNDEEIVREYYPESAELIKKLTGASRVHFFDHTIRRRRPDQVDSSPDKRQPVAQAHVDQTTRSAIARVHRHLPAEDVPSLLSKRFQLINLWRPISHIALDWPLALADYRSVNPDEDVFPVALVYPDREGETLAVKYREGYQWKYLYGMTPDELVLIKCYDSKEGVARFTPHTGFEDPATPEGSPLRESIELRALVFYDEYMLGC